MKVTLRIIFSRFFFVSPQFHLSKYSSFAGWVFIQSRKFLFDKASLDNSCVFILLLTEFSIIPQFVAPALISKSLRYKIIRVKSACCCRLFVVLLLLSSRETEMKDEMRHSHELRRQFLAAAIPPHESIISLPSFGGDVAADAIQLWQTRSTNHNVCKLFLSISFSKT